MKPLAERLWSKVDKSSDCWTWNGYRDKKGYGYAWAQKHK